MDAIEAAARATRSADNPPNAWYNLSMFSAEQNDEAKVEIALGQGKKLYDKREDIKKREIKREIDRSVKGGKR